MGSLTMNFFSVGRGVAARISEISFTKNPESEFFIKNPNPTKKKKKSGGWEGRGWVWLG